MKRRDIDRAASFDHLVGAGEQRWWEFKAKRLGGLEIDDELKLGWLLHWQISGLLASDDPGNIGPGSAMGVHGAGAIAHQAAIRDEAARVINGGQRSSGDQRNDLSAPEEQCRVGADKHGSNAMHR